MSVISKLNETLVLHVYSFNLHHTCNIHVLPKKDGTRYNTMDKYLNFSIPFKSVQKHTMHKSCKESSLVFYYLEETAIFLDQVRTCPISSEPRHEKTCFFAFAKTKAQISCAVTTQLISAFVFATWIVLQPLYLLNQKFQASCCTTRFVSDLVGNPKDRFSRNAAHIL